MKYNDDKQHLFRHNNLFYNHLMFSHQKLQFQHIKYVFGCLQFDMSQQIVFFRFNITICTSFLCFKLKKLRHNIRTWEYGTSSSEIYETSHTKANCCCHYRCINVVKKRFGSSLFPIEELVPICWHFHHFQFCILMFDALQKVDYKLSLWHFSMDFFKLTRVVYVVYWRWR